MRHFLACFLVFIALFTGAPSGAVAAQWYQTAFTASGTWTKPVGVTSVSVLLVGGGGGAAVILAMAAAAAAAGWSSGGRNSPYRET